MHTGTAEKSELWIAIHVRKTENYLLLKQLQKKLFVPFRNTVSGGKTSKQE